MTKEEFLEKVIKCMNLPVSPCEGEENIDIYIDGIPAREWLAKHPNCVNDKNARWNANVVFQMDHL